MQKHVSIDVLTATFSCDAETMHNAKDVYNVCLNLLKVCLHHDAHAVQVK